MSGLVRASSARMEHNRILAQKIREQRTVIKEQRVMLGKTAEILQELVSEEPTHEVFHALYCDYCEGKEKSNRVEHYEFCPWIKAKSLLAEFKGSA